MSICGNDLLCLDAFGSKKISVISLDTLSESVLNTDKLSEYSVCSAFTNGESLFFSTFDEDGIYELRNNKILKIIPEKIYNNQLCFDGRRVVYSSDKGIFALDNNNLSATMLSEAVAEKISSDGDNIVFLNGGKLFYLGEEITLIYDKEPLYFALFPRTGQVILRRFDSTTDANVDILIDIPVAVFASS